MFDINGILNGLPVVTIYFSLTLVLTTILISFRVMNPKYIILDWMSVYKNRHFWRILTNYFYIGSFSFNWLMSIAMFFQFSTNLESNTKFRSKGSYLYFIFLQMIFISTISLPFYWPSGYPFLFESLHFALLYYWSKMESLTPISIYFIRVKGYQMPTLLFLFHLLTGGSIINDIIGLLSGHLYHYVNDLTPNGQNNLLKTPQIFDTIAVKMENFTKYVMNEIEHGRPNQGTFRGRGVRLQ